MISERLKKFDLGAAGLSVFHYALSQGQPLAARLLERLKRTPGRVTSLLPPWVTEETLSELAQKRWCYWPSLDTRLSQPVDRGYLVAEFVERFFASHGSGSACVVEDIADKRGNVPPRKEPYTLYFGEFPYYFLLQPFPGLKEAEEFLGTAEFFEINCGALLCWPKARDYLACKKDLNADDLSEIAERVEALYVPAFDCEGYIFWEQAAPS